MTTLAENKQDIAQVPSSAYGAAKRALDLFIAGSCLILFAPVLAMVAVAIKLDSKGPVFFKQCRLGRFGKLFTIYKLRTMVQDAPEIQNADGSRFVARHDARLTRIGRILRDFSIDELPQLWNVLKGDMSIVGPRPDQPGPNLDTQVFRKKRQMKPGITSLASVQGRNRIPWPERVAMDVQYVEHASFVLDLRILLRTIAVVLRREGIYYADNARINK